MFIGLVGLQIAIYHYDMYVKVAYDNFDNKRQYDDEDMMTPREIVRLCCRYAKS